MQWAYFSYALPALYRNPRRSPVLGSNTFRWKTTLKSFLLSALLSFAPFFADEDKTNDVLSRIEDKRTGNSGGLNPDSIMRWHGDGMKPY